MMPALSRAGDLSILTLNRPDKLNALSFEVLRHIDKLLDDPLVTTARALVITGAGDRAFCAGADVGELGGRGLTDQLAGAAFGQAVFDRLARLPIVTIAAINGYAFGGGLELALACTFRVASRNATFGLPEIKLGLIPGYGGTQRLPRIVGESRALEMILTGRTIGVEEAERWNLVSRVADDALAAGRELASEVTCHGLAAIRLARDAVGRALDLPIAEGLRMEADLSTLAYQTADAAEGMAAFIAKRPAVFRDA